MIAPRGRPSLCSNRGFAIRLSPTGDAGTPVVVYLDRSAGIVSVVWRCERRIVLSQPG